MHVGPCEAGVKNRTVASHQMNQAGLERSRHVADSVNGDRVMNKAADP